MQKNIVTRKLISVLLMVVLLCQAAVPVLADGPDTAGSQPAPAEATALLTQPLTFSDMVPETYWSFNALTAITEAGLMQGDVGKLKPNEKITRAEMITIVLRALGLDDSGGRDLTPFEADVGAFKDVHTNDWYFDEIAMAYKLKLMNGTSGDEISPNGIVSREQAFTILCRLMALDAADADLSALNKFSDAGSLSAWAKPYAAAMTATGFVSGSGSVLNPKGAITRQEFAQLMYNLFGSNYISGQKAADALSDQTVTGNVIISESDITLSGLTVNGDVVVGDGVGNGEATFEGVTISGRLIVRGGGENTIYLKNTTSAAVIVEKLSDGGVRIHGDGGSAVEYIEIPDGNDTIVIDCDVAGLSISGGDLDVVVNGKIETMAVSGDNVSISGSGSVGSILLEKNVNAVTVAIDNTNIINNTGRTVAVTGKDGKTADIEAGASAAVNATTKTTGGSGSDSNTYLVTFHNDGGRNVAPIRVVRGNSLGSLPLPQKDDNMIFIGWFTDDGTFTDEVTGDTPINSNMDLYACYMPGEPIIQMDAQTTTSVMDADPDYSVAVLSSDTSMTAGEVKAEISVDPLNEDNGEFGGITVTGDAGSYTVAATEGYTPGCSYALTLATGSALTFEGKEITVRTYNITVKMPDPVLNLQLDNSVKAIPAEEISDVTENGVTVASIFAPLLTLDGEPVDEISGTFIYSGSQELFLGDKLAIYEGTPPAERVADEDYSGQNIAYVNVTGVNGNTISYSNAEASEVVFTPDVLPVNNDDDEDGVATDSSITIEIARMTYTGASFAAIGLDSSTVIEAGDYLAFYEGEEPFDESASVTGYAEITGVTVSGEYYVITHTTVTYEELLAAMDMSGSRTLTYDQLSENTNIGDLEKSLQQRFMKNGFADAAADYLIALANADPDTREQVLNGLGIKNFSAAVSDAPGLIAASSSPSVDVSATISNDLSHFGGNNGLRCDVTVTCVVAIGDDLSLTITGTFSQEVKVGLDISSKAVWKVWGIFPYIADYKITASLDVYNYTGLALNALLTSDDGATDLNIKDSIQGLQDTGGGTTEEKNGAVRRFYEIYQDMLAQDHDYFELFSVPIFKINGYVDPLCIIAYGFKAEFVVSLDVDVSLGAEFGYEKAKRYSVTLELFKRTAATSETDLIDENYGFTVYAMGTLGVRAGVKLTVEVGLFSVDLDSIGFSAEVGGYWRIWGFVYYQLEHNNGETTSHYGGACYMELGIYLEVNFVAQLGSGELNYVATLYEHEWPLLTIGSRYYVFDFQYELDDSNDDIILKYDTSYQLPSATFKMLQMDLRTGLVSEKTYSPSNFTLEISDNSTFNGFHIFSTGLLAANPGSSVVHRLSAKLTATWKNSALAFTSTPISRTFYLKWDNLEDSYFINFEPNGGTCVNKISAEWGAPITLPAPKLTGYTFGGWYLDNDTFDMGYNINFMPDSNPTLYAKWIPGSALYTVLYRFERLDGTYYTDWSVSYKRDGSTGSNIAPSIMTGGVAGYITPAVPVDENGEIIVAADGSTTVELNYVRKTHTTTYKPNNGEDDVIISAKYLSQSRTEPSFTKPGYTFSGWFTDDGTFNNRYYSFWQMPDYDVTVYAKWSQNTYTITYDLQNGSFEGPNRNPTSYNELSDITLINPIKDGNLFLGWTGTGLSAPTRIVTIPIGSTGNRYYTAQWQSDYTISYNLAGGSITGSNPAGYNDETPDFTLINPTRDGYIFTGWTGTGLSAPTLSVTIPEGSKGNRQYTATWTQIVNYTVRHLKETYYYNPVGGYSLFAIAETETLSGGAGLQTAAAAKTYEGYTAQSITQATIAANGSTTVDIRYDLNSYSATFDANGGQGGTVISVKHTWSMALLAPAATRAGYYRIAWEPAVPDVMPMHDVTFTAQWGLQTYSISYSLAGGSPSGSNPTSYNVESPDVTINNHPTRYGYEFAGWTGPGLSGPTLDVTIPTGSTGNKQYTANWTEDTSQNYHTLTFYSDYPDGVQVGSSQRLLPGEAITAPSAIRTGYQIYGWYSGDDWQTDPYGFYAVITDGVLYYQWNSAQEAVMPDHDLTLYADWIPNGPDGYTVVFDANGALQNAAGHVGEPVTIADLVCAYDEPKQLPLVRISGKFGEVMYDDGIPHIDGPTYEVVGWNTKEDGTGISYGRGDFVLNLADEQDEVILYAQWLPQDEFGIFNAMYSAVGQAFCYDEGGALTPLLYDASRSGKPKLDMDSLGYNLWKSGYFRVKKTGDDDNPIALYMYSPGGCPLVPYTYDDYGNPLTPEGSLIGSGNSDGLTGACKQSLESLYGEHWADGLVTVGNITELLYVNPIDYHDEGYGFIFTSVNGVRYFICGSEAYSYGWEDFVFTVLNPAPAMNDIDAVHNYGSGPYTPGG